MPKIGQLEAHLIRRVPNLKKMQLEKERLEQVDLENARLLGRIKKMGKRKGREFTKSSAAEDILPLVLQRRKRERKRKNKELDVLNKKMKDRINKIKYGANNNLSNNNKKYPPTIKVNTRFQSRVVRPKSASRATRRNRRANTSIGENVGGPNIHLSSTRASHSRRPHTASVRRRNDRDASLNLFIVSSTRAR